MKYYLLCLSLLLVCCQQQLPSKTERKNSQKSTYKVFVKDLNHLFQNYGTGEFLNDSLVYKNVLRWKKSEECATLFSYAASTVELLRVNPKLTDYQLHQHKSCEAIIYGDTTQITFNFSPFGGGNIAYFENKPITLKIHQDSFHIDITHTSDASAAYIKDGKVVRIPFPKSQFESATLTLNQTSYEVGDTIKGTLYAKAFFRDTRRKGSAKNQKNEIIKGSFRAIVEDRKVRCLRR